jgi:hypothetical protein
MRFKNDNDNRYRANFMRATEALIDKTTVAEFIEHLENNAELEDESSHIYIDGKTIWCKDYVLKETDKLYKEFLVSEDGSRLFYVVSVKESVELVDNSAEIIDDSTEAISWEQQPKTVMLTNELCSTLQCYTLMTTKHREGELKAWEELAQDKYIFTLFSYNGALGRKLLSQCIYKVMGYDSDRTQYKPPHTRQKIGVYCTKAQKLEIELEFEFYERLFEKQQELFLSAFIQKQRIFPPDAPVNYADPTERDIKVALMAEAIERKTRVAMIESSED